MSVILGLYRRENASVETARMQNLAVPTVRYAPDGMTTLLDRYVGMAYQLFATAPSEQTTEHIARSGCGDLVTFDGRLDNHAVLAGLLGLPGLHASHADLVLAAFQGWGERSFAQFVGDWSLALWSSRASCLYLARDHAGTRTLYYAATRELVLWSTYLETFFIETPSRSLSREFVVKYLRGAPIGHVTPYEGIIPVPAGHFLKFSASEHKLVQYWSPLISERIHYPNDLTYESHLLHLLRQAVERRTAKDDYVVTQLSGGMDSSTIVAVSDQLRHRAHSSKEDLLNTVSFFDPTEPSWNELPYVEAFENHRGKVGIHIRASYLDRDFEVPQSPYLYPGADASILTLEQSLEDSLGSGRCWAILSGIGGDEMLGGSPNPLPELADYGATLEWSRLLRQGFAWGYSERISLWHLLVAVCRAVGSTPAAPNLVEDVPWLRAHVMPSRGLADPCSSGKRLLPSTRDRAAAWESILETMPHTFPAATVRYEYRYPLLDRDLIEFLLRLPPDQVRRPGDRRSLMRRTVGALLPPEVLGRRRKASLKRGPVLLLEQKRRTIEALFRDSLLEQAGYIDSKRLLSSLDPIRQGSFPLLRPALMRALQLEIWLRSKPPLS